MRATKLVILTLLVALGSCGRETIETSGGNTPATIGFTAHQTKTDPKTVATRGATIDGATDLNAFQVWTYAYNGTFANTDLYVGTAPNGAVVTRAGADWDYGMTKYWPAQLEVTSFAIAPTDAVYGVTLNNNAAPTISYLLPEPGSDQKDLLFATRQDFAAGTTAPNGNIPEIFSHALSQISFKAYKAGGLTDNVTVTSVTLNGLQNSGIAPLETPVVWGGLGGSENYTFTFANGVLDPTAVDMDNATLLDAGVGAIFMMPQQNTTGITIDITYTIGSTNEAKQATMPVSWAPGMSYAITFAISSSGVVIPDPLPQTFTESDTYVVTKDGYYFIEAWGGDGGNGGTRNAFTGGAGGQAQRVFGIFEFNVNDILYIQVGAAGASGVNNNNAGGGGGGQGLYFGSGGDGGNGGGNNGRKGGGGGAASGILLNGTAMLDIIMASAGGGGGGGAGNGGTAGVGGIPEVAGATAGNAIGGVGGVLGTSPNSTGGTTNSGNKGGGGGGGGGYLTYSGGGGGVNAQNNNVGGAGGGGGANYVDASGNQSNPGNIPTPNNPRPANVGNGAVIITYLGQ